MNCWRTFSVESDFGKDRVMFISIFTMLLYFILHYLIFRTFVPQTGLVDYGLPLLFLLLVVILPLHLLLHCIPIWMFGKKATPGFRRGEWPNLYFKTKQTLPKHILLLSFACPLIVITLGSFVASVVFAQWIHYIAIMAAINMGLCVYDVLHIKLLVSAPKSSFVEEHRNGYHVLYKNQAN